MPILNEAKNSASCLILDNSYLYVFGGESGTTTDVDLTYQSVSIESLHLNPKCPLMYFWNLLQVRLHIPLWGIGALELSKGSILLFGGSDRKSSSDQVFVLEINEPKQEEKELQYELKRLKTQLAEPDWFGSVGTGLRDPDRPENLLILGQCKVHVLDLKRLEFTGCYDDEECFNRMEEEHKS
jgi:hypothetical protein